MAGIAALWLEPVYNDHVDAWQYIVVKSKNTLNVRVGEQLTQEKVQDLIYSSYEVTITEKKG